MKRDANGTIEIKEVAASRVSVSWGAEFDEQGNGVFFKPAPHDEYIEASNDSYLRRNTQMIGIANENNTSIVNRAKAIAAMGLVGRDFDGFTVTSPGFRKETFRVWKDEEGKVHCSCAEFHERLKNEPRFRCEHIIAVKLHIQSEEDNVGSSQALPETVSSETQVESVSQREQNKTEEYHEE